MNEQSRLALLAFSLKDREEAKEKNREKNRLGYIKYRKFAIKRQEKYQRSHPEHYRINRKLRDAVRRGYVTKPKTCSRCPNLNPQGHHPDYSKPLEVVWLCQKCHFIEHQHLRSLVNYAII